jgi:hypothetical protein
VGEGLSRTSTALRAVKRRGDLRSPRGGRPRADKDPLFYVADQHFEFFAERSSESQDRAQKELSSDALGVIPINLDTVAGYEDLGELAIKLDTIHPTFLEYERADPVYAEVKYEGSGAFTRFAPWAED